MSATMEERLKRRKLDALKRGVHRIAGGDALPMATHIVGIGKAGAEVIAETLRHLEPDAPKINALAIDIGPDDLSTLWAVAADIPPHRAKVTVVSVDTPERSELLDTLRQYRAFLTLEYPNHRWTPEQEPWLPPDVELPRAGGHVERAVAKAIYGHMFYGAGRSLERHLRAFANGIDGMNAQSVIVIVFGLSGGTGSGIAVDLARHLSNGCFGRRVLVAGLGIMPCDGDPPHHDAVRLFPLLNELDCLNDEAKNRGIIASCGELFRNPFTAGFLMVPQQPAWDSTGSLADTHRSVDRSIASLLTRGGGTQFWELLRLLNWVAAPSTQHSAARTPWGNKWIHMLAFGNTNAQPADLATGLRAQLGLLPSYQPEFIEIRLPNEPDDKALGWVSRIEAALSPDVQPNVVEGGADGSIQFILPSIRKSDLRAFALSRESYDASSRQERLLNHSLLLEHGILLSEPSQQLEGMAGESIGGGLNWIAVSYNDLHGVASPAPQSVSVSRTPHAEKVA
jgi:hypothetical protein